MHKIVNQHVQKPRIELMKANEVSVHFLEELIVSLKARYDIISLDEIENRLKNPSSSSKKFIVFTFDDGYMDNLSLAYPVLKKHEIPFTIYITNSFPDKTAKLWWYMLEDLIIANDKVLINDRGKELSYSSANSEEKEMAFHSIRAVLINRSLEDRDRILYDLERRYDMSIQSYVDREALGWDEIIELSRDELVTIGCHTMNHLAMNTLSYEEMEQEVLQSKIEIEKKIGKPVRHFAYPYGTIREVGERELGHFQKKQWFKTSTTTRMGNIQPQHINALNQLPRIQVLGDEQDLNILDLYLSGMIPALKNRFKTVVTV